MFDLVIRKARIVDGTGGKSFVSSLAVTDGKIVAIQKDPGLARETIDADGLVLAPGIIDGHTHYDAQLSWDPFADPSTSAGVTTVVIGNCGFTITPCRPEDRDLTMRNLTQVEGMSIETLRSGIRWDFETFPQYLDMLERIGVGPNVACLAGHSSIRTYVLRGDAAKRTATDDELTQMQTLVREAMAAGAVGFGTSTNEPHVGANGIPMPSRFADEREMQGLAKAMGESGKGIFMITKGTKTSVGFLEELSALSGRPVLVAALLHSDTQPEIVFNDMSAIHAARRRGRTLYGQVSCLPLTMDLTLQSPYPFESVAAWQPAMQVGTDLAKLKAIYSDPAFRAAVSTGLDQRRGLQGFSNQWDKVRVSKIYRPENAALEGRDLAALAQERRRHPLEVMLDIGLSEDLETIFSMAMMNSNEEAVAQLIKDDATHIALSDAGAHLSFLCDADFGAHLLGHWVRERGVMSLENAVHKLTLQVANIFGIKQRGRLAVGNYADLLLFDPATVGAGERRRVADMPAGGQRLTTAATGLHGTWVNGQQIAGDAGLLPNAPKAGTVLRDFAS